MRNQRRRGRPRIVEEEASLWKGAHERNLADECYLQVVGLGSPTSTAFARILTKDDKALGSSETGDARMNPLALGSVTLDSVVDIVLEEACGLKYQVPLNGCDLFRLGAVWLLSNGKRDRRLTAEDVDVSPEDWNCITLRIHYNPPRYPSSWRVCDAIIHEVRIDLDGLKN